jgi:hypothetical protein
MWLDGRSDDGDGLWFRHPHEQQTQDNVLGTMDSALGLPLNEEPQSQGSLD